MAAKAVWNHFILVNRHLWGRLPMVGARRSPEEHWKWDEREAARALTAQAVPFHLTRYITYQLRSLGLCERSALCAVGQHSSSAPMDLLSLRSPVCSC